MKKISLFLIPDFYVFTEIDKGILDIKVLNFENERSMYGYKKPTLKIIKKTIIDFCTQNNLKIAFHNEISYQLHKQGRSLKWLHRTLNDIGYDISYQSFAKRVSNNTKLDTKLQSDILKLIKGYE